MKVYFGVQRPNGVGHGIESADLGLGMPFLRRGGDRVSFRIRPNLFLCRVLTVFTVFFLHHRIVELLTCMAQRTIKPL
jgi:hypothetical protein